MIGGGVMVDWATPDDLRSADIGGVTASFTNAQISYWLGRAQRAILDEVPVAVLADRIDSGKVAATVPADVQIDLALEKFGNPSGIRTIQESNGPSSGSVTFGGDAPGKLALTADHRRKLGIRSRDERVAGTVPTW